MSVCLRVCSGESKTRKQGGDEKGEQVELGSRIEDWRLVWEWKAGGLAGYGDRYFRGHVYLSLLSSSPPLCCMWRLVSVLLGFGVSLM